MNNDRSEETVSEPTWFKSSYSGGDGGECVEVDATPGAVRVRDSKDREGGTLAFSPEAWTAFVAFAASAALLAER
ncbi:DUF397 domain-containing protein [Streptomyces sp. HB2AG]|uniref:DUF397 domain-containing protein n=1 Tax=Streptomyces sp. HB2AG TaxID=2983400 RepID=UPI0022AAB2B9|nr:DUF397 domain-containing protein [Streptomyces sp. HB2AG]MCZ2525427.1 DUF397 domain-containing protein [Streptomyces sp. HB2AG]